MKITYDINEIGDIVRAQAERDFIGCKKRAGDITTEYISEDDGSGVELKSMTIDLEDK